MRGYVLHAKGRPAIILSGGWIFTVICETAFFLLFLKLELPDIFDVINMNYDLFHSIDYNISQIFVLSVSSFLG